MSKKIDYEEYNNFCNEFKDFIIEQYKKKLYTDHNSDDMHSLMKLLTNLSFEDVPDSLKVDLFELYLKNNRVVTEIYI